MGHVNYDTLKEMIAKDLLPYKLTNKVEPQCSSCIQAMEKRNNIPKESSRDTREVGVLVQG
jgi:hypothetical protein